MSVIRVKRVDEFKGEDVVLLAIDSAGLATFVAALNQAQRHGAARLHSRRRVHEFIIEASAADIELGSDRVVWRLDHVKAIEISEKLQVLSSDGPGHHYVDDMHTPAPTLVLSRDEYLSTSWLTSGKEPMFAEEDD